MNAASTERRTGGAGARVRDGVEASAAAITAIIVVLAIGVNWVAPIGSSLWLDETGTVWAIRGTLRETIARAFYPGQPSVLFSVVTWLVVAVGGLHEVTLRVPSLIAAAIASIGVYRLVRRFGDASQSLLATALFATYGTVVFAAADARPYAPALMAVVWAMLLLVRWCETGQEVVGIAWALAATLGVYFHYFAATMLPVFIFYVIRQDRMRRPGRAVLWRMSALVCILLLALLPHAAQLWRMRVEHSFSGMPELRDVIDALVYYRLAAGIFVGAVAARLLYPDFEVRREGLFTRAHFFLALWYLFPVLSLLVLSVFSEAKVFVPRYYMWGVPGLAILTASALSAVHPLPARRVLGLIVLLAFCGRRFPAGDAGHGGENWRGALSAANASMVRTGATLLLRSGFPEMPLAGGREESSADDPLMAPLAMYPVAGKAVLIPCWLKDADRRLCSAKTQRHEESAVYCRTLNG
jgi:mannosyltransferase